MINSVAWGGTRSRATMERVMTIVLSEDGCSMRKMEKRKSSVSKANQEAFCPNISTDNSMLLDLLTDTCIKLQMPLGEEISVVPKSKKYHRLSELTLEKEMIVAY